MTRLVPRLGPKVESLLGLRVAFDREAGKDHLDSLGSTREAPGRPERTNWTTCEAPGRQERINWTACEAPGRQERSIGQPARHQGGRKELFRQPGRHQGDSSHRIADRIPVLEGRRILYNF